jgi:hypothetical protein
MCPVRFVTYVLGRSPPTRPAAHEKPASLGEFSGELTNRQHGERRSVLTSRGRNRVDVAIALLRSQAAPPPRLLSTQRRGAGLHCTLGAWGDRMFTLEEWEADAEAARAEIEAVKTLRSAHRPARSDSLPRYSRCRIWMYSQTPGSQL